MAYPIIELHPSLAESTVLYRTLDFFNAAEIVTKQRLMFSRADTFLDRNEGIDRLLMQLAHIAPNKGCGMGWHDGETARSHHEKVKKGHYISCWSLNAESVAMWSLYSPDYSSVRISSTVSKLRRPVGELLAKYKIDRFTESNLTSNVVVATEGHIAPVKYASLSLIFKKITRRVNAFHRIESRYARKGTAMPQYVDVNPRYHEREAQREFTELKNTCRLKDKSFQHENEVRLSVRLGQMEPAYSKKVLEYMGQNHQPASIQMLLSSSGIISDELLPLREFSACSSDLIDTVAIDPRCPPHKAEFIRNWFVSHGVTVVESECFGYLPDSFEVYPQR